jgi:hypothetical protein
MIRPSVGWDGKICRFDSTKLGTEIFLQRGLDTGVNKQPVGQITDSSFQQFTPSYSPIAHRMHAGTSRVLRSIPNTPAIGSITNLASRRSFINSFEARPILQYTI